MGLEQPPCQGSWNIRCCLKRKGCSHQIIPNLHFSCLLHFFTKLRWEGSNSLSDISNLHSTFSGWNVCSVSYHYTKTDIDYWTVLNNAHRGSQKWNQNSPQQIESQGTRTITPLSNGTNWWNHNVLNVPVVGCVSVLTSCAYNAFSKKSAIHKCGTSSMKKKMGR